MVQNNTSSTSQTVISESVKRSEADLWHAEYIAYLNELDRLEAELLKASQETPVIEKQLDMLLDDFDELFKLRGSSLVERCSDAQTHRHPNLMTLDPFVSSNTPAPTLLYLFESLLKRGVDFSNNGLPLHTAIDLNNRPLIDFLLNNKVNLNQIYAGGPTLLTCMKSNNLPLMEELIRRGADVQWRDHEGWSLLHYAAAGNHENFILPLLNHGFKISDRTAGDASLMEIAEAQRSAEVIRLLKAITLSQQEHEELSITVASPGSNEESAHEKQNQRFKNRKTSL